MSTKICVSHRIQSLCISFYRSVTITIIISFAQLFVFIVLLKATCQSIDTLASLYFFYDFCVTMLKECLSVICFSLNRKTLLFRNSSHLINLHKTFSASKRYVCSKYCWEKKKKRKWGELRQQERQRKESRK